MKRLSLEELKAQKIEQVKENLEAVNGGTMDVCHFLDNLIFAIFNPLSYQY